MWNREKYCARIQQLADYGKIGEKKIKSKEELYRILGDELFVSYYTVKSWTRKTSNGPGDVNTLERLEELLGVELQLYVLKESLDNMKKCGLDKVIEIGDVLEGVAKYYGIDYKYIIEHRKCSDNMELKRKVRRISMYLLYNILNLSYTQIAEIFDNTDSTIVMFHISKIKEIIEKNEEFSVEIKEIEKHLL